MSSGQGQESGQGEREIRGLDLPAFHRWYDGERPGDLGADLRARFLSGGKSNLTYAVTDGATVRVVRRPPLGHVQATAHDMGREFTVMSALADTAVPVPHDLRDVPRRGGHRRAVLRHGARRGHAVPLGRPARRDRARGHRPTR